MKRSPALTVRVFEAEKVFVPPRESSPWPALIMLPLLRAPLKLIESRPKLKPLSVLAVVRVRVPPPRLKAAEKVRPPMPAPEAAPNVISPPIVEAPAAVMVRAVAVVLVWIIPPLSASLAVAPPSPALLPIWIVPEETVTVPVMVLAPPSSTVPAPLKVRLFAPETMALTVRVLPVATVQDCAAPRATLPPDEFVDNKEALLFAVMPLAPMVRA